MVKKVYIPEQGDVVWVSFDSTSGHEQTGRRPALVLSRSIYNGKSGLALIAPITASVKGYPFEVPVDTKQIRGVVLIDQVRSIDWRARKVIRVGFVSSTTMGEVRGLLVALVS
jgi:mRNA interferase MazF